MPKLILASSSPRRREFMERLGLNFVVCSADIDETPLQGEPPHALAVRLAASKAQAARAKLAQTESSGLILAADTVVAVDDMLLGKPGNDDEAWQMLRLMRARSHHVISAVSLLDVASGRQETRLSDTLVNMRSYSDDEIATYIASGDPFDKAGGYAIQHEGFHPVASLSGCVAGVIGLPLAELHNLLADFGVVVEMEVAPICTALTGFGCCQIAA